MAALFLQREVSGPGAEERDHVSAADHPVPDEEERNGLSTAEYHKWVKCLFYPCSIIQFDCYFVVTRLSSLSSGAAGLS